MATVAVKPTPHDAPPGSDDLGIRRTRRRTAIWITALSVLLVLSFIAAVGLGAVFVPPGTTVDIITHHLFGSPTEVDWRPSQDAIVWEVRLPRAILGVAVGAGLTVCGVALQAMVRNMLADPYLIGVNSGASAGAAAAILFGVGAAALGELALQGSAFIGALVACALVFMIARAAGRITSVRLLMTGVAVGYALSALTSFLIFASDSVEGARSVMFWLLGSLTLARWGTSLLTVLLVVVITVTLLILWGRHLDALAIGDETAHTLGVYPARFRAQLLFVIAITVGVLVASSGSIGFVGLVVPHLARRIVGGSHRRVIPVAALLGAIFLVWADLAARTLLSPQELPIGIITAIVGAPFLLILVRRLHAASAD